MKEKYESLQLSQLKELAKVRGLKGTSSMKKAELVEAMLAEDERLKKLEEESAAKSAAVRQNNQSSQNSQGSQNNQGNQNSQNNQSNQNNQSSRNNQSNQNNIDASRRKENSRPASPRRRTIITTAKPDIKKEAEVEEHAAKTEDSFQSETVQNEAVQKVEESARPYESVSAPMAGAASAVRPGRPTDVYDEKTYPKELDSGEEASGILEVMPDGYGFIRCENYLPGENDVYVAPSQIRRFGLKTGDILHGNKRVKTQQEKFSALLFIRTINGYTVEEASQRKSFEDMTPIFPNERIRLETPGCSVAMRVMDLVSPVGKGQRGMIVSPPKAGKTTLLKEVAKSILRTNPHMHMLILLIDERPEEVTDIKEAIIGDNVEVIYSTFDELPEHHKRVSEMVIERAKRLVEHKKDVVILLDSITRLARAYNLVVPPSGRTLSGGLDPAALHMPKRFFGAARNMREGGSLTILATALVDTGSKMDDVVYEEFKGTGNMEMILDRKLSEKRIFPAIDLAKSGTRREDLLLNSEELEAINIMRRALNGLKSDEATDRILDMFAKTRNNNDFVQVVKKNRFI